MEGRSQFPKLVNHVGYANSEHASPLALRLDLVHRSTLHALQSALVIRYRAFHNLNHFKKTSKDSTITSEWLSKKLS